MIERDDNILRSPSSSVEVKRTREIAEKVAGAGPASDERLLPGSRVIFSAAS